MQQQPAAHRNAPYIIEQVYDAPAGEVWAALSDKDRMKEWYFPQLRRFEPVAGFKFEFDSDGAPYRKTWIVTDIVKGKKMAHSWAYEGFPGLSEVSFEIFGEGEQTRLRVTHTGIASFPADPHFAWENFDRGWRRIIGQNLKLYLTKNI